MEYKSKRFGNHTFSFERVNVILGANGAGKSKLLAELRDAIPSLRAGSKPIFIEGGRTIKINDVIKLDANNFKQYDRLDSAMAQYENKRKISLADRLFDALIVLEKRELHLKSTHSDLVEAWENAGRSGDYPKRQIPPLSRLFDLFSEIFPQISLSYDYQARRLSAQKDGVTYGPSSLSDGEKQVFSILADLIDLEDAHSVIIADEPELNLHPELAERLWTLIENEFEDKTFIYATHSINFALRSNVRSVFVLSADSANITEFTGLESLPRNQVTAFLGGLPGILSANKVVVTEGHEKSFDAIFYRWLLTDPRLEIYPAGGCADVAAVVTKSGLWSKIATKVSLCGVVDTDYRDESYLASHAVSSIVILPLHEAESYLCLPEVASAISERIGSQEKTLTKEAVSELVLDALSTQRLAVAARRVFSAAKIHLSVSVERKVLAATYSRDALVAELRTAADSEIQKANATIGPSQVESALDRELSKIDAALQSRDVIAALRLVPAKEVLAALAPRAGCKNGTDLMRSLKRNFSPSDFPRLEELRSMLERAVP